MTAQQLVEFIKLPSGTLRIKRLRGVSVKQDIREIQAKDGLSDDKLMDVLEYQLCNGWRWLRSEDVGALTDAPILTDDTRENSAGELTWVGDTWWYPEYMVSDPIDWLLENGYVDFTPAPENGQDIVGCVTLDHLFYHEHCLPGNEEGSLSYDDAWDTVSSWIANVEAQKQGYICRRCGEVLSSVPHMVQPSQTGYPSHNGRDDGWGQY